MRDRKTAANIAGFTSIALFLAVWPVNWLLLFLGNRHWPLPDYSLLLTLAILLIGSILLALIAGLLGSRWWLLATLPTLLFTVCLVLFFPPI